MSQIVRDLVDAAIVTTRSKLRRQMRADIAAAVEETILDSLIGTDGPSTTRVRAQPGRSVGHLPLGDSALAELAVPEWVSACLDGLVLHRASFEVHVVGLVSL